MSMQTFLWALFSWFTYGNICFELINKSANLWHNLSQDRLKYRLSDCPVSEMITSNSTNRVFLCVFRVYLPCLLLCCQSVRADRNKAGKQSHRGCCCFTLPVIVSVTLSLVFFFSASLCPPDGLFQGHGIYDRSTVGWLFPMETASIMQAVILLQR